jgi:hypothetical protein
MSQFISGMLRWGSEVLDFNQATLSGAIDIVVIRHQDGTLLSTPFHVRFGKLQLLKSAEKLVTIAVNGETASFCMKLGKAGEAFFVEPVFEGEEIVDDEWATSPLESPDISPPRSFDNNPPPLIADLPNAEVKELASLELPQDVTYVSPTVNLTSVVSSAAVLEEVKTHVVDSEKKVEVVVQQETKETAFSFPSSEQKKERRKSSKKDSEPLSPRLPFSLIETNKNSIDEENPETSGTDADLEAGTSTLERATSDGRRKSMRSRHTYSKSDTQAKSDALAVPSADGDQSWTWWSWRWGGLPVKNRSQKQPLPTATTVRSASQDPPKVERKQSLDVQVVADLPTSISATTSPIRSPSSNKPLSPTDSKTANVLEVKKEESKTAPSNAAPPPASLAVSNPSGYRSWITSFFSMFVRPATKVTVTTSSTIPEDALVHVFKAEVGADDLIQVSLMVKQSGSIDVLLEFVAEGDKSITLSAEIEEKDYSVMSRHSDAAESIPDELDVEMSLCGKRLGSNPQENFALFKQYAVTYESLCHNPALVFNPDLIIRYRDL